MPLRAEMQILIENVARNLSNYLRREEITAQEFRDKINQFIQERPDLSSGDLSSFVLSPTDISRARNGGHRSPSPAKLVWIKSYLIENDNWGIYQHKVPSWEERYYNTAAMFLAGSNASHSSEPSTIVSDFHRKRGGLEATGTGVPLLNGRYALYRHSVADHSKFLVTDFKFMPNTRDENILEFSETKEVKKAHGLKYSVQTHGHVYMFRNHYYLAGISFLKNQSGPDIYKPFPENYMLHNDGNTRRITGVYQSISLDTSEVIASKVILLKADEDFKTGLVSFEELPADVISFFPKKSQKNASKLIVNANA